MKIGLKICTVLHWRRNFLQNLAEKCTEFLKTTKGNCKTCAGVDMGKVVTRLNHSKQLQSKFPPMRRLLWLPHPLANRMVLYCTMQN